MERCRIFPNFMCRSLNRIAVTSLLTGVKQTTGGKDPAGSLDSRCKMAICIESQCR